MEMVRDTEANKRYQLIKEVDKANKLKTMALVTIHLTTKRLPLFC